MTIEQTTNEPNERKVFEYLDALRESGATNMYGATPYIQKRFGTTRYEAQRLLTQWMETYSERHSS
jgi:hypothetical protein